MPENTSNMPIVDIDERTRSKRWAAMGSGTGSSGKRRTSSRAYSEGEGAGQVLKAVLCGLALSEPRRWDV